MPLLVDLYQQYNPVTDWPALARSVAGAYIKYSDGSGGAKVAADNYAANCGRLSIPYGGYHYAEAGDPVAQARVFLSQCARLRGNLAPALDLESGDIPYSARGWFARAFLETVHQQYPLVVLYASASWLASLTPDTWPYEWDRTWCAAYGPNDGARHTVTGYRGRIDMHQFTSAGRLPGVSGSVDLDWTDNLSALRLDSFAPQGEDDMTTPPPYLLDAGDNRSISFRVPAWARYIVINCPYDYIQVHWLVQAKDAIPPSTPNDPLPFGFVTEDKEKRVDRLRPWLVPVGPGVNQGAITYTYSPDHLERKADLSFAP